MSKNKNKVKLTEITDEAAKNAGIALSKLSREHVSVVVEKAVITNVKRVFPDIDFETRVAGIYLPVTGDIQGASLLIFPEKIAFTLCDILNKKEAGLTHQLDEMDESALKEVGNILCGSFMTVFSNKLKIKIIEHISEFSFDMFGAVVDQILAEFALKTDDALVIEIKFSFEERTLKGYVVLLFGLDKMKVITDALEISL